MPDSPDAHPSDHFSSIAKRYASYRPRYPRALVELLREHTSGDVVWDVGCGNGQLSTALGDVFARVIATDLTQKQLDAAEPHPHVEYRRATAEASGLADASVDLVVAAQAAHWFEWPRFLAEVERVARPGALVALVSYGNPIVEGDAGREIVDYHDNVVGPFWPAPGRHHVETGYRELVMPWPAIASPAMDLVMTWTREQLAGYISSWSATARMIEAQGRGAFDALCARLAVTWPDDEPRVVRWPLTIKLARR